MNSIPPWLQSFIMTPMPALLSWFSGEVYRRMRPLGQTHYLVQLQEQLDLGPLEAACAGYHHSGGPGPNGEVSRTAYHSQSGQGRVFRFSEEQCQGCPLLAPCRSDQVGSGRMRQACTEPGRSVFISDHRSALAQARTYAQTTAYREELRQRAAIERIIMNLGNYSAIGAGHFATHRRLQCPL